MRMFRHAMAALAAAALTLGVAQAPAGATAPPQNAEPTLALPQAYVVPSTCLTRVDRMSGNHLILGSYSGTRATFMDWGTIYSAPAATPQAMAYNGLSVAGGEGDAVFSVVTVYSDGSLWDTSVVDSGFGSAQMVASTGWGRVRQLTASPREYTIYALVGSSLVRYQFDPNANPLSRTVLSTTWSGVREIAAGPAVTMAGASYDSLYALTTSGGLNLYLVPRYSGRILGSTLVASSWGGISQLSAGGCKGTSGAVLVGLSPAGVAYMFHDRNLADRSGADVRSAGPVGRGFSGLIFN